MDEIMLLKLIFGCLLSIGAAVLFFLSYKIGWKYMVQEKRCTTKTKGTVKRYGISSGNLSAAIVYFEVNGRTYKARAWTPLWVTSKTKQTFTSDISQDYKEDGNKGSFRYSQNAFVQLQKDPTRIKHPKGQVLDVWYDPKNPKLCYAERYANKKAFFWILFLGGVFVLAMDIVILVIL